DAHLLQLLGGRSQVDDVPPAERAVESPEEGEVHGALPPVLSEGHGTLPARGGKAEVGSGLSRLDGRSRIGCGHGASPSIPGTAGPRRIPGRARLARTPAVPFA